MLFFLLLFSSIVNPLFQSFDILGTIRDVKGQSVTGVRVSMLDENYQPVYTAFVDPGGRFSVKGVRSGRYVIRIDTTGTPYQELQTGWLELHSLRALGGGRDFYPVDLILKFKPGNASGANAGTTFAQVVPPPARKEYERGAKNLKSNKSDAALASLRKAVEIFPDYYEALELLGTEYVRSGQYDAALPVLKHALEVNSRAPRTLYALGVAYLRLNRIAEAIESLEKSARLDPTSVNTQMMLGLAYGSGGQLDQAEAFFRKALQAGGVAAAEAHYYLAGLYNKREKFGAAAQELELYLKNGKDIKDPPQIKAMIARLREKDAAKPAVSQPATQPAVAEVPEAKDAAPADGTVPGVVLVNTEPAAAPTSRPDVRTPEPLPPLSPAMTELLDRSEKNGGIMHRRLRDYTYQLKKTQRLLNEQGKPVHALEQVFEAYPVRGEHVLILLSRDGLPSRRLSDDRKRAMQELEEAERERLNPSRPGDVPVTEGYVSAGVSSVYRGQAGYVSISPTAFLQACEFYAPRLENQAGRATVVMSFRPRADVRLTPNLAYITRLVGTIWIDQEDGIVTRLEGWPVSQAAFDLVQTTAPHDEAALIYQQVRQANGLWAPSLIRMNAGGRDLFGGLNWDIVFEFSNYQQFNTSTDDVKIKSPEKKP